MSRLKLLSRSLHLKAENRMVMVMVREVVQGLLEQEGEEELTLKGRKTGHIEIDLQVLASQSLCLKVKKLLNNN